MSNFNFLRAEWPALHGAAHQAESYAKADARTSCFHARRTLELLVRWLFEHDGAFRLPYDTSLNALLADSSFKRNVPQGVALKAEHIRKQENLGLFVRRLTGMDRRSAQAAFATYLDGKAFTADQIAFVTFVVEHFTRNGFVDLKLLYERPFTDINEGGLDGVFSDE